MQSLESSSLARQAQAAWEQFCSQHGDDAFNAFFRATSGLIFNTALRETRDRESAGDIMQQCYVHLLHESHEPDAASQDINRLAITTALREANNSRKKTQRRAKVLSDNAPSITIDRTTLDARSIAADEQLRSKVLEALEHLPRTSRRVVELAFLHELSPDEIAAVLNISRSGVTKQLKRARGLLTPLLRQSGVLLTIEAAISLLKTDAWAAPPDSISPQQLFTWAKQEAGRSYSAWGRIRTAASTTTAKSAAAAGLAALLFWTVSPPQVRPVTASRPPTVNSQSSAQRVESQPEAATQAANTQQPLQGRTGTPAHRGAIRGRIVSVYDQEPLMNIPIFLMARARGPSQEPSPVNTTVSGGDGSFRFETLPHGSYQLTVNPTAPWVAQVVPAEIDSEFPAELGDIQLNRTGRISGRLVRMPGEVAVPRAKVELRNNLNDVWPSTVTGPNGEFVFDGLTWRNYDLVFPEHGNLYHNMTLADRETKDVLIPLGPVSLSGRVLRDGMPYANVKAWAIRTGEGLLAKGIPVRPDGTFSIDGLVPDIWQVLVEPRDAKLKQQNLSTLVDLRSTASASCELVVSSAVLTGSVVDQAGSPLPFASVRVISADPSAAPNICETTASQNGRFLVDGLPPGRYSVSTKVEQKRSIPIFAVLENAGTIDVGELRIGDRNAGKVTASALSYTDGKPLGNAWLDVCTSTSVLMRESGRDTLGVLTVSGLTPGHYIFRTGAYGYSVSETSAHVEASGETRIDAVLHEAGGLRWTISRGNGAPAEAFECKLKPVDSNSIQPEISGRTDELGEWLLRGILPGLYEVEAVEGDITVRDTVRIHAKDLAEKWTVAPGSPEIVVSSK